MDDGPGLHVHQSHVESQVPYKPEADPEDEDEVEVRGPSWLGSCRHEKPQLGFWLPLTDFFYVSVNFDP